MRNMELGGNTVANQEHLDILEQGAEAWNRWRKHNPAIRPDFSRANLSKANLRGADLSEANLNRTDLTGADLTEASLYRASLVETGLKHANLTGCRIYGISAWDVNVDGAHQSNLVITRPWGPKITLDNLEVAQFLYLLLNNEKLRDVIDTITSKVVLILGRFTLERKEVLDAIRDRLRQSNYTPVLFDFDKPASRNITETVSTLAHMARFVIADITDARSIPQELQRIVPDLPSVPIQPLLQAGASEWGMFDDFRSYPWVLPVYHYHNIEGLLGCLREVVIEPAEAKAVELRKGRVI